MTKTDVCLMCAKPFGDDMQFINARGQAFHYECFAGKRQVRINRAVSRSDVLEARHAEMRQAIRERNEAIRERNEYRAVATEALHERIRAELHGWSFWKRLKFLFWRVPDGVPWSPRP